MFKVLLLAEAGTKEGLDQSLRKNEFQGLLSIAAEDLSSDIQNELKRSMPGKDFSKVYLLREGKEPWSGTLVMTLFLGGVVAVAAAVCMYLVMGLFRTA
jgi:hypothetical protein